MRYALFAAFLAAGCYGGSLGWEDYPLEDVSPEENPVEWDPALLDQFSTAEHGTEKMRPVSRTIDWPVMGPEQGKTTYAAGSVMVDRILRQEADNSYGVRVRLKNTTGDVKKLEYHVQFYTRSGERFHGTLGLSGTQDRWKPFVLDPYRTAEVADFCRVIGAEGFQLAVRAQGDTGDGSPQGKPE